MKIAMRRLIRWTLALVLAVGLWMALVLSEWLPRPTAEEQAALAALAEVPASAKGERDGFAAAWFLAFEVPDDQLEAMLRADVAAYDQLLAETGSVASFRSTAEGRFAPVALPPGGDPLLCELWNDDCLERIRADPEATRQRLAQFAPRLQRSRRLAHYDHFRYAFTPRFDSPIPGLGGIVTLQLTEAVLQYVDGHADRAFATLCSDTAAWRRLRSRSDMLINDMIGVAQMSNAARIYGGMLAEQPVDFAPPCPEVFAPLSEPELDQCAVMRFEYISVRNSLELGTELMMGDSTFAKGMHRFANAQHLVRRFATVIGPYCQEDQRKRTASRDPAPPQVDSSCRISAWIFDPAGCFLIESETPSYHGYHLRLLDLDARLRLLNAAIWLRGRTAAAGGDQLTLLGDPGFAARPVELDSPLHDFTWDAQRGVLRMRNLQVGRNQQIGRGEFWEVPVWPSTATNPPQ